MNHSGETFPGLFCTVGWVGSKLHYLEQLLQSHSDWIMSAYPEGKTDDHSLEFLDMSEAALTYNTSEIKHLVPP